MNRRDFLIRLSQTAAFSGLSLGLSGLGAEAQAEGSTGPFYLFVHASGGWDPTSYCDPKGAQSDAEDNPMNKSFLTANIESVGPIRYAPLGTTDANQLSNRDFFQRHASKLLVLNGIDVSTNGHDSGRRAMWSGTLSEGYPAIGALIASVHAPTAPMSFLSSGGYDYTAGLIPPTRSGRTSVIENLAYPNRANPADPDSYYNAPSVNQRILQAQADRLNRQRSAANLPRVARSLQAYELAKLGVDQIANLSGYLPETLDTSGNRLRRQAQLAIAAFRAGIAISGTLSLGGFDTHGSHDRDHLPLLGQVNAGIDFILEEADRQGLTDQIVIVVGSEFGRSPRYNATNGKDHWSITSMMMLGPGIEGGRVVGGTTHEHGPLTLNPQSLALDESGVRLTPAQIHRALRQLAGVSDHPFAGEFPLVADELRLF